MNNANLFPSAVGTYILVLHLEEASCLIIGKRGTFDFPAGFYAYVGSAFGGGGLRGRLKHHLQPVQKPHWHIDYLRASAMVQEVWYLADETRYEHQWAKLLENLPEATIPVSRFGSSDCNCESHLIHFANKPDFEAFKMRFVTKSNTENPTIQQVLLST